MITIKPKLLGVTTLCVLFGSCTYTDIRNASATGSKDGSILPFPEPPSASTYGETIFESRHVRREQLKHLPPDAPNIVLVLMDDVGFGTPSTFGGEINTPTMDRVGGIPTGIKEWSPLTDKWELYNLEEDWTQANDLSAKNPVRLEEIKALFLAESAKYKNLPISGGLCSTALFHPEDAPASSLTEWTFIKPVTYIPESAAPKLGKNSNIVSMEVDLPANANGVLYALAGFSGGVTCYMKNGYLNYKFNLFDVERTMIK